MKLRFSALVASTALAAPLQTRALSSTDVSFLHITNMLAHLEWSFLGASCDNFNDADYEAAGFPNIFRAGICFAASQKAAQVDAVGLILQTNGITSMTPCTPNVPLTDPLSAVRATHRVTYIGIGAYLGGMEILTDSPTIREALGSLATVDARHNAILRAGLGLNPYPTASDTALSQVWAFNLAYKYIADCPEELDIIRLPRLNLTALSSAQEGTELAFAWDPSEFLISVDPSMKLYIAIVNQDVSNPTFLEVRMTGASTGTVLAPVAIGGAAFTCLTTFSGGLTLDALTSYGTLAGPEIVIVT